MTDFGRLIRNVFKLDSLASGLGSISSCGISELSELSILLSFTIKFVKMLFNNVRNYILYLNCFIIIYLLNIHILLCNAGNFFALFEYSLVILILLLMLLIVSIVLILLILLILSIKGMLLLLLVVLFLGLTLLKLSVKFSLLEAFFSN